MLALDRASDQWSGWTISDEVVGRLVNGGALPSLTRQWRRGVASIGPGRAICPTFNPPAEEYGIRN